MKNVYIILIFWLNYITTFAQRSFDFQFDKVYLHNNDLVFINEGESYLYSCYLEFDQINDFEYRLDISCESDLNIKLDSNYVQINSVELTKFKDIKKLNKWLQNTKFVEKEDCFSHRETDYFNFYNNMFVAKVEVSKNLNVGNLDYSDVEFYQYALIKINKQFNIIAIFDINGIKGYVVPFKQNPILVYNGCHFELSEQKLNNEAVMNKFSPKENYHVKKINNKFQLFDNLFQYTILKDSFKSIKIGDKYILCEDEKGFSVYNNLASRIIYKNLKSAFEYHGSLQVIKDNKLAWINSDGKISSSQSKLSFGICGTYYNEERKLFSYQSNIYEFYKFGHPESDFGIDTIRISSSSQNNKVLYLNGDTTHNYNEYSNLGGVFSFPYSYYIFKYKEFDRLISINNLSKNKFKELFFQKKYLSKSQIEIDRISDIMNSLVDTIETKIIFTGKLESYGYNHPIKFKENNKYGYFPITTTAKYINLEKFNLNFARFELEDGRKGWLDINGKEYMDD